MNEMKTVKEAAPLISSLSQHRVPIPKDIQDHLRTQFQFEHATNLNHILIGNQKSESNCNDDNGTTTVSIAAHAHFNHIVDSMKTSPEVTICRVNLLLEPNVDKVLEEINQYLGQLFREEKELLIASSRSDNDEQRAHVHVHSDCPKIIARRVEFKARKHDILHDVIEIHIHPKCIESIHKATSLSYYSSIPQSLCHGSGIAQHWPTSSSRQKTKFPLHCKCIIVDRFCGEAVLRGSNIFVRGVLAADKNIECDDNVCVYAHVSAESIPRGLTIENYHNGHCVFLGLGLTACTRAQMFNQSAGLAVIMFNNIIHSSYNDGGDEETFTTKAGPLLPSMNGILSNKIILQNLPSILVAHVLNPKPKDIIIDLCCAPGGKTSHVASLVNNDATIVAVDKSRKKMRNVKQFFQDMGASCITPFVLDSTKCVLDVNEINGQQWIGVKDILTMATSSSSDGLLDVKGFYPNSFDKIVLDPPCSALGLRPKLAVDQIKSVKELNKHAHYQRKFIQCAVSLLKPGGILVYSTCTINVCENEQNVKYILDNFKNMKLLPINIDIGLPGLRGCGLSDEELVKVRRFDPSGKADTMGFFIAKFQKSCSER